MGDHWGKVIQTFLGEYISVVQALMNSNLEIHPVYFLLKSQEME